MRSTCGKIRWGSALGVYLAEGRLTLTRAAMTPLGVRATDSTSAPVGEGGPAPILKQWLESNLTPRQRRAIPVCVGLGAEQTFFTTRTFEDDGQEQAPSVESLLASAGSASFDAANAAADYMMAKFAGTSTYSIAACQRKLAEDLLGAMTQAGITKCRLELAPWGLMELMRRRAKTPHGWKVRVRVVLGKEGGLAVLESGDRPLFWRRFGLAKDQEPINIASAVRHLEVHASQKLPPRKIAGVIVQGEVGDGLVEALRGQLNMEVIAAGGEAHDDSTYGLALAVRARKPRPDGIDMFRPLRPPPTIKQMFPRKTAALMVVLVAGMGLFLWDKASELEDDCRMVKRQNAGYKWAANVKTPDIENERKQLTDEVAAVQKFLATRIVWADYLRDLPTRLPPNSCFTMVAGTSEMQDMSGGSVQKKSNKSLTVRGMARFADRSSAPKEIDAFLESLRAVDILKRDFPLVNMAEIKWRKDVIGDIALFTIIAMPKQKPGAAVEAEPKEKARHGG